MARVVKTDICYRLIHDPRNLLEVGCHLSGWNRPGGPQGGARLVFAACASLDGSPPGISQSPGLGQGDKNVIPG